jgi:GNAT superfamily N-acetyltransferase
MARLVGFAICLVHEATWVKEPVCYLEDLFLDEAARGQGIGKALLDDLVTKARSNGWARLYWHTTRATRRRANSMISMSRLMAMCATG